MATGAAVVAMAAAVIHSDALRFADPDFFVTLYAGKAIAQGGGPPGVDAVTFSVAGQPWSDYEWLARWVFYEVFRAAGAAGIVLLRIALVVLTLTALGAIASRRSRTSRTFLFVLALLAPAAGRFFLFRPTLFTFAAVALLLLAIEMARDGRRWLLWIVPPAVVLWANLHAGFALGVVLLGMLAVESAGIRLLGDRWRPARPILPFPLTFGVFAASVILSGIHPLGYHVWRAVFGTLGGANTPWLSEWGPMHAYPFLQHLPVYLLMVVLLASLALARTAVAPFDLMATLSLMGASLLRVRFIPLFSIVAAAVLLSVLPEATRALARWRKAPASMLAWDRRAIAPTALAAVVLVAVASAEGRGDLAIEKVEYMTPVSAVKFLKENGIAGNILSEYDWGGYLVWEIPDCRIFVDGRSDTVYPAAVTTAWGRFVNAEDGWEELPPRYRVRAILLRPDQPVVPELERSPEFVPVFADAYSRLFLARSDENAAILEALRAGRIRAPAIGPEDYRIR